MKEEIIKKEQVVWFFVIGAYFFLLYFLFYGQDKIISLFAFRKTYTAEAIIGFGTKVKEDEIITLLESYSVTPLSASGFTPDTSTTISNRKGEGPNLFLKRLRAIWIESHKESLQWNHQKIQHFLGTYSKDHVVARKNLQREAHDMLYRHFSMERAIVVLKRGYPFISSMEVLGDSTQLERLGQEKIVKGFKMWLNHDIGEGFPFLLGEEQSIYDDPDYQAIQALSGREAYQQLKNLVTQGSKEDR